MLVTQESRMILKEIDICRNELNNLASTALRTSEQVLKVSRKLDKLILNYYLESERLN